VSVIVKVDLEYLITKKDAINIHNYTLLFDSTKEKEKHIFNIQVQVQDQIKVLMGMDLHLNLCIF